LIGKPEGKRPLRMPRRSFEDNIRMDIGKLWTGCIWLRYGSVVGFCERDNKPSVSIKGGVYLD
jgi:hypothetical protein